jgi:branched-chain amino acid aminotransferase
MPPEGVLTLETTSGGARVIGEDATLADASARLPRGAYSTLRTYGGRGIVRFEAHLRRLEGSAGQAGRRATIDPGAARRLVRDAVRAGCHPESRLRLTFAPPRLFASVEAFVPPPPSSYRHGISCVTLSLHRDQPRVKDTGFIPTARRVYDGLPPGVDEGLLVSEDGEILEGLSSNFFVLLDGSLHTEEERVLPGITRALVLEVAAARHPVVYRAARRSELPCLEEAFITSASREVLPVVRIDGEPVGDGGVGPHTRAIMEGFAALVRKEVEIVG